MIFFLQGDYKCMHCNACFAEKSALENHMLRHTGAEPTVLCNMCPKKLFSQRDLVRHVYAAHGMQN